MTIFYILQHFLWISSIQIVVDEVLTEIALQLNGASSINIQHIHGKIHLPNEYLPMRWV